MPACRLLVRIARERSGFPSHSPRRPRHPVRRLIRAIPGRRCSRTTPPPKAHCRVVLCQPARCQAGLCRVGDFRAAHFRLAPCRRGRRPSRRAFLPVRPRRATRLRLRKKRLHAPRRRLPRSPRTRLPRSVRALISKSDRQRRPAPQHVPRLRRQSVDRQPSRRTPLRRSDPRRRKRRVHRSRSVRRRTFRRRSVRRLFRRGQFPRRRPLPTLPKKLPQGR